MLCGTERTTTDIMLTQTSLWVFFFELLFTVFGGFTFYYLYKLVSRRLGRERAGTLCDLLGLGYVLGIRRGYQSCFGCRRVPLYS